ncbi:hypothetical protein M5D96_012308 [Drosophila gunungcola]|uniref:Uncharacterized protein n=1 Tax=Drosophila gunungcola TaxID=103775 RepID=A0A9P9YDJ1_9MUSC|nr:hypothetical protein M5D96_012308 [Drosophila gunungcola]
MKDVLMEEISPMLWSSICIEASSSAAATCQQQQQRKPQPEVESGNKVEAMSMRHASRPQRSQSTN